VTDAVTPMGFIETIHAYEFGSAISVVPYIFRVVTPSSNKLIIIIIMY
jgi:hypothetical protein